MVKTTVTLLPWGGGTTAVAGLNKKFYFESEGANVV